MSNTQPKKFFLLSKGIVFGGLTLVLALIILAVEVDGLPHLDFWPDSLPDGQWFKAKARMIAQWLLPSVPALSIGGDFHQFLEALAADRWCEAFEGKSCKWPRQPQEYARDLDLRMAAIAEDCRMRFVAGATLIASHGSKEVASCEPRPEIFR